MQLVMTSTTTNYIIDSHHFSGTQIGAGIKRTLQDLGRKGQQRPGIVTLDGVIIDGNRRAMLLRRLEGKTNEKQYFEAIILPDAYDENEKEIVRLETQYQLGEDAILDYGPLEKYLKAKRLKETLGIDVPEIAQLMGRV